MWCGIDVGSSHVKVAVIDDNGQVRIALSRPAAGRPLPQLADMLNQLEDRTVSPAMRVAVTGVGKEMV
ncbi:MAG: hypothetical protein ACUVTG_11420, partial [Candidatus Oleimicrobiaceae bacterium]